MTDETSGSDEARVLTPAEITAWCSVIRLAEQLGGREAAIDAWEARPLPRIRRFYEPALSEAAD